MNNKELMNKKSDWTQYAFNDDYLLCPNIQKLGVNYCKHCITPIRRFTVSHDWNTRGYHKKCFKLLCDIVPPVNFSDDSEDEEEKRYIAKYGKNLFEN